VTPSKLSIAATGLVTSMGFTAPASCAGIRGKLSNPVATRFMDANGDWIMAHEVPLPTPWRGLERLGRMAAMAVEEALADVPKGTWQEIPLLLCVAECERPGRVDGVDDLLLRRLQQLLGVAFAASSAVIPDGRVAVAAALAQARVLLDGVHRRVLLVGVDSMLSWLTLRSYEERQRLLTAVNSNGFMPGEGAAAVLVDAREDAPLVCTGVGFGVETAHVDSELPLRADGLSDAIRAALSEAGCEMHDMHFRITDLAGEHYYFKEAALALSRTLRGRKEEFDLWHPAEAIGETGAVAGLAVLAVAHAASCKGFGPGPRILAHMANDDGRRAALVLSCQGSP
jgi:3-oxoacyl-[acyl-carrier-protein] synthase I